MDRPVIPFGLPADFDAVLAAAIREHVLDESIMTLEKRAMFAIEAVGSATGLASRHRMPAAWAAEMLAQLREAIHFEICAVDGSGLKAEYADALNQVLTKEGIAELAAIVLRVVRAISPSLAVSTVGLYVAVWLLKVGLNRWCTFGARTALGTLH
jgi:hypothetical protein